MDLPAFVGLLEVAAMKHKYEIWQARFGGAQWFVLTPDYRLHVEESFADAIARMDIDADMVSA